MSSLAVLHVALLSSFHLPAPASAAKPQLPRMLPPRRLAVMSAGESAAETAALQAGRRVAMSAALSSFLQGYSTGVIGGVLLFLSPEFGLDNRPLVQGLIVSATTIGSVIGTCWAPRLSDRRGRRATLRLSSALFVAAGAGLCWAPNPELLLAARFLVGLAIGNGGATVPIYIAECARSESRGALATLPQLFVSAGILTAYLVSLMGSTILSPLGLGWRLMTGFTLLPALVQAFCVWKLPESPRWLLTKGRADAARRALLTLRGARAGAPLAETAAVEAAVDVEFTALERSLEPKRRGGSRVAGTGWAALLEPKIFHLLVICTSLQALQQLSGINAIIYYTPQILREVGAPMLFSRLGCSDEAASLLATTISYLPKLPTMFLTMRLMDLLGRRELLRIFVPLLALCHLALGASFAMSASASLLPRLLGVLSVMLYGIFFSLGLGPIPNILTAELFPPRARSAAMACSLGTQFVFNTLVSLLFPVLRERLGSQTVFFGFSAICALATLFVTAFVPETKGVSLEELAAEADRNDG